MQQTGSNVLTHPLQRPYRHRMRRVRCCTFGRKNSTKTQWTGNRHADACNYTIRYHCCRYQQCTAAARAARALAEMALKKAALLQLPVVVDARAISHTTPAPVTAAVLSVVESILRARASRPSHRTASETRLRCTRVVL
jgi:hypothetical protein